MDCTGPLYERLWRPVLLAALNADPREASARLAGAVVRESLARGGAACRPLVAADGLGAAFVDPALAYLHRRGAVVRFGRQLQGLDLAEDRVRALDFGEDVVELTRDDVVILAVPAWVGAALVPELTAPKRFRAILNAHFAISPPPGLPPMLGVVNAMTEWLFSFPDRMSVTVSAADRFSAVQPLPRCRRRMRVGRTRERDGATSFSRAIGRRRGCRPPSKVQFALETGPPTW
jgi:hypothetical protein